MALTISGAPSVACTTTDDGLTDCKLRLTTDVGFVLKDFVIVEVGANIPFPKPREHGLPNSSQIVLHPGFLATSPNQKTSAIFQATVGAERTGDFYQPVLGGRFQIGSGSRNAQIFGEMGVTVRSLGNENITSLNIGIGGRLFAFRPK